MSDRITVSHNKKILLLALSLATSVCAPVFGQEPNFDIQDEKLLCIGSQEKTGYHQYCVEQCVVNGPSTSYVNAYTYPAGDKVLLYSLNGEFDCQRGQAQSEIFQKKAKSFMNRLAKEKGCLAGTYIRTLTSGLHTPTSHFAAANAIVECAAN